MVQWPTILLGTQGLTVKARSSPREMVAFTKNSSRHKRMRQASSDSSSPDSCAISNLMTLARAGKVTLMWGIVILWLMQLLFFPPEAWKSSSSEGLYPRPKPPLLSGSSIKVALTCPIAPRP